MRNDGGDAMRDEGSDVAASGRRSFLKKAGVGMGLAWAAPTVLSASPAAAQGTILVTDDFAGATNTFLDGKTTTTGGFVWSASSFLRLDGAGLLRSQSSGGQLQVGLVSVPGAGDNSLVDVDGYIGTSGAGRAFGAAIRATDSSNMIYIRASVANGGTVTINTVIGGTLNTVASSASGVVPADTVIRQLRTSIQGNDINVRFDGVLVVSHTLTPAEQAAFPSTIDGVGVVIQNDAPRIDYFQVANL